MFFQHVLWLFFFFLFLHLDYQKVRPQKQQKCFCFFFSLSYIWMHHCLFMYQIDLEIVFSLGDVIDKVKPFDCVYLKKRDRFNVVKKKIKKKWRPLWLFLTGLSVLCCCYTGVTGLFSGCELDIFIWEIFRGAVSPRPGPQAKNNVQTVKNKSQTPLCRHPRVFKKSSCFFGNVLLLLFLNAKL